MDRLTCRLATGCLAGLVFLPGVADRAAAQIPRPSPPGELRATVDGVRLSQPRHDMRFGPDGLEVVPRSGPRWSWRLAQLVGETVGLGGVRPVLVEPDVVRYARGAVDEEYRTTARGVEQRFVIHRPLALGGGDLVIAGAVECAGSLVERPDGWAWSDDRGSVSLGDVYVFDRDGRSLPARMEVTARRTRITVDGAALEGAAYPVTVDPEIGSDDFRISAMGPDGDTSYGAFDPAVAYGSQDGLYLVVWYGDDDTPPLVAVSYTHLTLPTTPYV